MLMWRKLLNSISAFKRSDSGVQLVELAIVLPILLMMFAAVAEFGRYFYEYTTLAKSSRTAVRYLTTACPNGTDDPAAKNLVVFGNLAGTGNPLISGLATTIVKVTRFDSAGNVVTGGIPATVTVEIINFKHTCLFDLGKLTNSSTTLNVDVKPSVTMR